MKIYILLFLIVSTCTTCSIKRRPDKIEYVKFFQLGYADSITTYNKGFAASTLLQYNFQTDSVIYRDLIDIDPDQFKTYIGKFKNERIVDTILNAVNFLKKYPEGAISSKIPSGDLYCGPEFFLEFKDKNGLHYYSFLIEGYGPLWDFHHFFFRIAELPWNKKILITRNIPLDSLAVKTAVKLGFYDSIDMPYIPITCEAGIEIEKIYGEWRRAGDNNDDRQKLNEYYKMTFKENSTYEYVKIMKDSSSKKFTAQFHVDKKKNVIVLTKNKDVTKMEILHLRDDCLTFKYEGKSDKFIYNRLKKNNLHLRRCWSPYQQKIKNIPMLITRKEITQSKPTIGSEITKLQKAFFDEELLQEYKDEDEEQLYWEMFDCVNDSITDYETHNSIIGLAHTGINSYTTVLSNKLKELFQAIGADEIYILSHLKLDLFGNKENQFKPLVQAYEKLETITGQTSYKEAFLININQLQQLIDIIFWLIRCDPGVPEYIFLFAANERLEMFLCKYGNIHLTEIGNAQLTKEQLSVLGWQLIEGPEYDRFSDDGAIDGRQLKR